MDQSVREAVRRAVGRGYSHPENARKEVDADLLLAIAREVESALEGMGLKDHPGNVTPLRRGRPPVPGAPGPRGGAATMTEQTCATCRAYKPDEGGNGDGQCRRHAPTANAQDAGFGLWPWVVGTDFCCEWLPQPVAQTPLKEAPPCPTNP